MAFYLTDRWGGSDEDPSVERMKEVLAELDTPDDEHPDAWLEDESGWCLIAYAAGTVVWEHPELGTPKHMRGVPRSKVLELWLKLSRGEHESIIAEPWSD